MKTLKRYLSERWVQIAFVAVLAVAVMFDASLAPHATLIGFLGAVVNTKAAQITNMDASTQTLNRTNMMSGKLREAVGTAEAANGDSIGSTYRLARVPSRARISRVLLSCDAITTCAGDVGVYRTAGDGGAVVDADAFASAQSLASALANQDVTHESGVFGVEDVEQPLWEALGLSADPRVFYDIVVTLTAAAGSAGTISAKVQWVED